MNTLFGENTTKNNKTKTFITLPIDRTFRFQLTRKMNQRLNYLENRLNENLDEVDRNIIRQNVTDMFNYQLTKMSNQKQVDYERDSQIFINLTLTPDKKYVVKDYVNISNFKTDDTNKLVQKIYEQLLKDYSTAAKYCILGYISERRKKRLNEY